MRRLSWVIGGDYGTVEGDIVPREDGGNVRARKR